MGLFVKHKASEKDYKIQADEQLVELYKSTSNSEIVGELFKRYTHLVFGVCMKYLKDEDQSKDAVMQIFEKLLSDLHKNEISNFKSWLYSVSKNHCLMFLRKEKTINRVKEEVKINSQQVFMESEDEEHQYIELDNNAKVLLDAVKSLPKEQQICIELFYLKEKSYKEVVEITGHEMKKVKSYIQNGKRNLKIHLDKIKHQTNEDI